MPSLELEQEAPMDTSETSPFQIKLYPIENEFIAFLDTTNVNKSSSDVNTKVETIVLLDQSGSMEDSLEHCVNSILPKFFELLFYDPEEVINLILFEDFAEVYKIKVDKFKDFEVISAGGSSMAVAVDELDKLFQGFASSVNTLRILTISDSEIDNQAALKEKIDKLTEFAEKCNISVNSQAVRLILTDDQLETTALSSLLQLNNVGKCKLMEIRASKPHVEIAKKMADLFADDGFEKLKILKSNDPIFYRFPWDKDPTDQLAIMTKKTNYFFLNNIPEVTEVITIDDKAVNISIEANITIDQLLFCTNVYYAINRMKILKVVDTDSARITITKMLDYFAKVEKILAKLATNEIVDPKSITSRAKLVKLNMITSKKVTNIMQTIANDESVNILNAAQKAHYLRNIKSTTKSGRGLARRATKRNQPQWYNRLNFDEIAQREVEQMRAHFDEIKDIDYRNHFVSFYSQATTIEGISTLIDLAEDPAFQSFSADGILRIINIVGVACKSMIDDFPDPSTWRPSEIYYGCYISVADIITSIHQSGDSGFVLRAPGVDGEITNVIPVFNDPRIGVFLKKYAPSILEFTSSIGMRRVVADVPMTFGYNIIAGLRKMMSDLDQNKSTVHLQTFKNFISTACLFVGSYYDRIEELLLDKDCGLNGYYLANNGIKNLLIPLVHIYSNNQVIHEAIKRMPDILRSIYNYEIWKKIIKEFKGKQEYNQIVKDMLHKLLKLDIESRKIILTPLFEPEPKREDIKFPDEFEIDQEYLDELTQPLYYHNYMSLLPQLLTAVTKGKLKDIKNIPAMTKTSAMAAFGIDYSYDQFLFLNVFQALRYPRGGDRVDHTGESMKILDVKNHDVATEDVRKYVREQFEAKYNLEVKAKRRQENEEMLQTLVDSLINETNYQAMINIWKNGIARNNITFKIANSSSNGFKQFCKKLVDLKVEVPLRSDKIKILLLGVDADGQVVFNNGKICGLKNLKKYKAGYLITGKFEEWDEIEQKFTNSSITKDQNNMDGQEDKMDDME